MRHLCSLGVAVALLAGVPASAAVSRRAVPVAVAFWDGRNGLAALTTFSSCGGRPSGENVVIERTTDGGRSWTRLRAACASETAFGGEVTLAITGPAGALLAIPGGLLRTTDDGASWSSSPAPRIVALSFTSSATGWAVSGGPLHISVQETRDGGRTWRGLHRPCTGDFAKVSLVAPGHGWLLCLGGAGAGNQGKAVYESRDGGSSWQIRARTAFGTHAVGRLDSYGYPTDVTFRPDGRGWMPQLRGATLTSRDGGRTWSPAGITAPEARIGLSVSFVSGATGFILVDDAVRRRYELDRSDDAGRTWHVVHAWPM